MFYFSRIGNWMESTYSWPLIRKATFKHELWYLLSVREWVWVERVVCVCVCVFVCYVLRCTKPNGLYWSSGRPYLLAGCHRCHRWCCCWTISLHKCVGVCICVFPFVTVTRIINEWVSRRRQMISAHTNHCRPAKRRWQCKTMVPQSHTIFHGTNENQRKSILRSVCVRCVRTLVLRICPASSVRLLAIVSIAMRSKVTQYWLGHKHTSQLTHTKCCQTNLIVLCERHVKSRSRARVEL